MSNQAEQQAEIKPEKNNEDVVVQRKLYSIIAVWISFVILYFAARSGSDGFMWLGLALTAATSAYLYVKN